LAGLLKLVRLLVFYGDKTLANNSYPRLCGGTFFTLVLQARKQRTKARQHVAGERDGLSETDTLIGLIKIVSPDYTEPKRTMMPTFKGNTSEFKSCKISGSTYLPFGDTAEVQSFDSCVQTEYTNVLNGMCGFVQNFIEVGTSTQKDVRLAKALLEIIDKDSSIPDGQTLYINSDGHAVPKAALCGITDICLPALLLGIWHFVLTQRKDNTVGKETYDVWCPAAGGKERKYTGNMGDGISRSINMVQFDLSPTDAEATGNPTSDEPPVESQPESKAASDKKSLISILEDAIDEFEIAEFVDNDYSAMPMPMKLAISVDNFVARMRYQLRSFRREQDVLLKNIINFVSLIEEYYGFLSCKMFCDDGVFCKWMRNNAHDDVYVALNYRRSIDVLYSVISGGGTLSVHGYPDVEDNAKQAVDSQSSADENATSTTNQTVNNPVVFNQYGNNNTQIGSVETLTIKNG
jgi:hypothetical protein